MNDDPRECRCGRALVPVTVTAIHPRLECLGWYWPGCPTHTAHMDGTG